MKIIVSEQEKEELNIYEDINVKVYNDSNNNTIIDIPLTREDRKQSFKDKIMSKFNKALNTFRKE